VRNYTSELVSGRWFGSELSIFEWHYIPEWHSECNTISIGYPVRQPQSKAVVQRSINNLNVFKSFQLMLAPPSTLLSNAMKFARIHARTFKDVLASISSDYICHHSSNTKTNSLPPPLRVYDTRPGSPKKVNIASKKAKINQIAVLRHIGCTYSKTFTTKQKYMIYRCF